MSELADLGYTVLRGIAPETLVAPARRVLTEHLGIRLDQPETWYRHEPLEWGVVPIHHPQAFWDLRQHPPIHAAFAELLGTGALWVSMDRGICRVPASEDHPEHVDESRLHWDLDPRSVVHPSFQGMLFLTDSDRGGPFVCAPTLFADLHAWLASHPDFDLEAPIDLGGHRSVEVPVSAGDLVIWDARLPHCGGKNHGSSPRLSLAVTLWRQGSEEDREERIRCWRDRRAPAYWRGWKGQVDPEPGVPATLTDLGRKLVGLDRW